MIDDNGISSISGAVKERWRIRHGARDAFVLSSSSNDIMILVVVSGEDFVSIFIGFHATGVYHPFVIDRGLVREADN